MLRWTMLPGLLLLAANSAAAATAWQVDHGRSRLAFTATQEGEPFRGEFRQWSADIRFHPEQLAASRFDVRIEVGSVTTFSEDRDPYLTARDWFFVRKFPQARYVAGAFTRAGDDRYVGQGELSLRGVTRPVVLRFSWQEDQGTARLQGEAVLDRTAFGVGQGDFASDELVGHEVRVDVDLYLMPNAAK